MNPLATLTRHFAKASIISISILAIMSTTHTHADEASPQPVATPSPKDEISLHPHIEYEQKAYSSSEAVELGQRTKLDAGMVWDFYGHTQIGTRFNTDPEKNEYPNETSIIESTLVHRFHALTFGVDMDFDLNNREADNGSMALRMDEDSVKSFIKYQAHKYVAFTLYPYNFGGEVGHQFRTDHVTRMFYIEGTPSSINDTPKDDERIRMKTIPGVVVDLSFGQWSLYVGGGSASYEYPVNKDFDITTQKTAERYEVRNDNGVKAGFAYRFTPTSLISYDYVGHDKSKKTGSLLAYANSLRLLYDNQRHYVEVERTETKAAKAPYNIDWDDNWFANKTPLYPVYADYYGKTQDWLDKTDQAMSIKLGYYFGHFMPYISQRSLGKYFIYRNRDSAHRLRTADESASHGGLDITAVGVTYRDGPLSLRPEVEFKQAKNEVFGNTKDLREDRFLRKLSDKETAVTIYANYQL